MIGLHCYLTLDCTRQRAVPFSVLGTQDLRTRLFKRCHGDCCSRQRREHEQTSSHFEFHDSKPLIELPNAAW